MRIKHVAAVVLLGSGSAWAQGTAWSYATTASGTNYVDAGPVPPGGFVLTDVIVGEWPDNQVFKVYQVDGDTDPLKLFAVATTKEVHLSSGIPFAAGTIMRAAHGGAAGSLTVTYVGYIPDPTAGGTVPAVSAWGLAVMLLALAVIGSVVIIQRPKATA